ILGITGDFDPDAMEARLRKTFDSWPKGPAAARNPDLPQHPAKPGIYFVDKRDVDQTNIRMVHLGARRDNPDYYAITVMNEILGGGFGARLIQTIRTKMGLAYAVGGGVGFGYDHPGLATFAMGTKSQTTVRSLGALRDEIDKMIQGPVTEDEMK